MGIQNAGSCCAISVDVVMNTRTNMHNWHVVSVNHMQNARSIIQLAAWCSRHVAPRTWDWGGGEFRFQNQADAVQFALLLD